MRDIDREGMIFRIEDSGEAVLTECSQAAPVLTIPAAVDGYPLTAIDPDAFDQAGPFEAFRIAGESAHFNTVDGVLFDRTGERLVRYPLGRDAVAYAPPVGTKVIGQNAFAGGMSGPMPIFTVSGFELVAGVTVTFASPKRVFAVSPSIWRNSPVMLVPKSVVATRTEFRPQSLMVVVERLLLSVPPAPIPP